MVAVENNSNAYNSDIVIITRTLPAAQKTALKVDELGLKSLILPAADIVGQKCDIDIENVQALIVTSSNAPRVAIIDDTLLQMPIYAVGDATKEACIQRGFENVISAGGDASALAVLIADRLKPDDGKLLHLRGSDVAGDVGGLLRACGFQVDNAICYRAIDNPAFKAQIKDIIAQNRGFILFHSPKGAERFAAAIGDTKLENFIAVTISQAAAEPIKNLGWREVRIAPHPKEEEMLLLLR